MIRGEHLEVTPRHLAAFALDRHRQATAGPAPPHLGAERPVVQHRRFEGRIQDRGQARFRNVDGSSCHDCALFLVFAVSGQRPRPHGRATTGNPNYTARPVLFQRPGGGGSADELARRQGAGGGGASVEGGGCRHVGPAAPTRRAEAAMRRRKRPAKAGRRASPGVRGGRRDTGPLQRNRPITPPSATTHRAMPAILHRVTPMCRAGAQSAGCRLGGPARCQGLRRSSPSRTAGCSGNCSHEGGFCAG
ncbi:MAG: hypothetical protein BWZ02_02161 [Lentisphaerae bacterium ADurb.BinA184]|nr:MAG: hypothetical protein BWZ02_02161 [Lentisphaerae bacterium ADurb.BinA184]